MSFSFLSQLQAKEAKKDFKSARFLSEVAKAFQITRHVEDQSSEVELKAGALGRWGNAFLDSENYFFEIPENLLSKLRTAYLKIIETAQIDLRSDTSAPLPPLTSESSQEVTIYVNTLLSIACQELLDDKGNLKNELITLEPFKTAYDQYKQKGKENEFRDGILNGFIIGIVALINTPNQLEAERKAYAQVASSEQAKEFDELFSELKGNFDVVVKKSIDQVFDSERANSTRIQKIINVERLKNLFPPEKKEFTARYNLYASNEFFYQANSLEEFFQKYLINRLKELTNEFNSLMAKIPGSTLDKSSLVNSFQTSRDNLIKEFKKIPKESINQDKIKMHFHQLFIQLDLTKKVLDKPQKIKFDTSSLIGLGKSLVGAADFLGNEIKQTLSRSVDDIASEYKRILYDASWTSTILPYLDIVKDDPISLQQTNIYKRLDIGSSESKSETTPKAAPVPENPPAQLSEPSKEISLEEAVAPDRRGPRPG